MAGLRQLCGWVFQKELGVYFSDELSGASLCDGAPRTSRIEADTGPVDLAQLYLIARVDDDCRLPSIKPHGAADVHRFAFESGHVANGCHFTGKNDARESVVGIASAHVDEGGRPRTRRVPLTSLEARSEPH